MSRTVHTPPSPRRSFTLIELVMVLLIIALISAIAAPRLSGSVSRHRAQAAARMIVQGFALARSEARARSAPRYVHFHVDDDSFVISGASTATPGAAANTDVISLRREPYLSGLLSADLGGDASVMFDIFGRPDSGGSVVVGCGDWTFSVALDAESGKASMP
jgi:prepilin-type N-terminal cleavage/methylation domain-containing protein